MGSLDWKEILYHLRTQEIISSISGLDPVAVATNPHVIIPALLVLAGLVFFKMHRTLAVFIGCIALWIACVYGIPPEGQPIDIKNIAVFGIISLAVAAYWVYTFIISGD